MDLGRKEFREGGGDGFQQDLATPFANHLDQATDTVGVEDVDPVEHLGCGVGNVLVVVLGQAFSQLADQRQDLGKLEAFVAPAHRSDLTRASTSSTVASTVSVNPSPKPSSSGSTSITTVSSGNSP